MNNKIKIRINGFNLSKIINYLISKNVLICDLVTKQKYIKFSISVSDKKILDDCCRFYKKEYIILGQVGYKEFLKRIPLYFGSLFACLLILCYIFSYNCLIYEIKIYNATNIEYDIENVKKVLTENNVVLGMNKNLIATRRIESVILNNLNNLSGCSVDISGGLLNIKIYPEQKVKEENDKQKFSKYDAVITDLKVNLGTSNFKVGDIVKKGEIIIDSTDIASGVARGNVYFSAGKIYNKIHQNKRFTGKFLVDKEYFIFNKSLLKHRNDIYFSNYLTKKCDFYIMENYLFPIKCVSEYYFEYEIVEEIIEFEAVEEEIKKELYEEVVSQLSQDVQILNTYYSLVQEGDLTRIDCFIEVNVSLI